jgi:hypothetical protein
MYVLSNVIGAYLAEISVTDSEDIFSTCTDLEMRFRWGPPTPAKYPT